MKLADLLREKAPSTGSMGFFMKKLADWLDGYGQKQSNEPFRSPTTMPSEPT